MSNTKRIVIAAIAVAAVVVGAIAYSLVIANKTSAPEADHHDNASESDHEGAHKTDSKNVAATITYNGSSFTVSKSEVTAGSNIKITNDSSEELDFGSDPHPTHTDNPELNAGDIAPHESTTIILSAEGDWGFHNHYNPAQHGNITVK